MDCTRQRPLSETPSSKNDKLECTNKTYLLNNYIWQCFRCLHLNISHLSHLNVDISSWDLFSERTDLKAKGCDENLGHMSPSLPQPQWWNQWNCIQVMQSTAHLGYTVLWPGWQSRNTQTSLWSHCSFLRDTVAATVQLARPATWLAAGAFSQMPVAFQLGTKRNSFAKHTMASV